MHDINREKSAEQLAGPTSSVIPLKKRATRRDGWTDARRSRFFAALALTANVRLACKEAGMDVAGAYRRRGFDATFRREWRAALDQGYARLETDMLERALIGEERVRGALDQAENDAAALGLLARYPQRPCELLYRTHRAEALAAEAIEDDTERDAIIAEIENRLDALRDYLEREAESGAQDAEA